MILEKIKSEKIAHNSYFIGSAGEAAVIDPRRDCDIYLNLAKENEMKIKYIFETHRNEDYVIGSKELKNKTDAEIYHSSKLDFKYGKPIKEKDKFKLGLIEVEIIETPGHTDESISITLKDKQNSDDELFVFTGDLLFAGDTGRIDLYGEKEKERLAENLYNSLHKKILNLKDGTIICPAHGKGSVCGGQITDIEYSTIGYEKQNNTQLGLGQNEFINLKVNEKHYVPPYFKKMEKYNKNGAPILNQIPFLNPISVDEFKEMNNQKIQILDIRAPSSFAQAHIRNSLNIWREGLPLFAGWFLDYNVPIVLIDDFNMNIDQIVRYLIRLGFDNIKGYLKGGFSTWLKENQEIEKLNSWPVSELKTQLDNNSIFTLDVREESDRKKQGFIKNSKNYYVGHLPNNLSKIPRDKKIAVYCDSGFKTSIAASILKKNGFFDVTTILGGFLAWKKAGYKIEQERLMEDLNYG
jgi:hydroxyacylglutathione hydrolase